MRDEAALLKNWGKIDRVTIIKPQKGTYINEGISDKQFDERSGEFRKGGGYQGLIQNKEIIKKTIIKTKKLPKEFFNE
jgi:hypothetical protein